MMNRNEIREIHHSIGEIERHLQDIHSTLASDSRVSGDHTAFCQEGREEGSSPTCLLITRNLTRLRRNAARPRRRDWKDGDDPWDPNVRFRDSRRKPPYVIINLPAKEHRKANRERIPIPVGEKWVHAGCNVFVRRDVYQCFTRVRDALSEQMSASFEGNWND